MRSGGPNFGPPLLTLRDTCARLVHAAHAAAARAAGRSTRLLLLLLDDDRFRREKQAGDRRRILQRGAGHLRGIDHARGDEILVVVREGVVAELVILRGANLLEDDRAFATRVLDDHAEGLLDRLANDVDADLLLAVVELERLERLLRANECNTAAGDDAFLDRSARGVQRVFDPSLLLLHLGFGRGTDVDHRHTAGDLRETLLELLLVVVRRRLVDRGADLGDTALDLVVFTGTVDQRGVVLVDDDALRLAKIGDLGVLELEPDFVRDHLAARDHRNVLQHRLATIAKARRLHGRHAERAAELVHDQRRERLTLDVLRNDQERLAPLGKLLEHGKEILHRGDLLVVNENEAVLEHGLHLLRIGDEVRGEIAAIELHAVDRLERGLEAACLLDRDHAILADLLHRLGDEISDLAIVVRGNGTDLRDLLLAGRRNADALELLDDRRNRAIDAALERHRVGSGGDVLETFAEDRLREHRGGGGAITGDVRRLRRDFLHHLRAHVLERIGQLDLLRNRDAVLGDRRRAELLVDDDVSSLRAERDLHSLGELVDAALERRARIGVEMQFLASHMIFG